MLPLESKNLCFCDQTCSSESLPTSASLFFLGASELLPKNRISEIGNSLTLIKALDLLTDLATPRGFEPLTYRLGICRSILLSYGAHCAKRNS